ncbi:ATP-binding cassette domain-containing protein [Jatrophihabitans cynanchi]|jgi:branched-chain amino acid transport system ATP-binding protein|uniref:ATP-binding cassette domain-containing protein n=1 Tax=Jatrophihabitans cynanchi TaxID=2944128 RepID=A0ABY7JUV8_9ACTN|nr:ATP-binding cassette domain-containing protein [Jatrophihabitans sp. SB3-54]WAX56337.1 ATP-binding cassette domain-containing protein [Jatrophihabitans sp. SB3-54]
MTNLTKAGEVLLSATGLRKRYGGVVAVDDVTVEVRAGEVLGLVGPNGAGKTTLVDLITGAQVSDAGTIRVGDRTLPAGAAARAASGLARTFQHPQLAMDLSVRDNIALGFIAARHRSVAALIGGAVHGVIQPRHRADDELVARLAAEVHLSDLDRLAGDLTLGEQRLVEVARALGADPRVLLLDEPFAGADGSGVGGISEVIAILKRRDHGVILVDHNVDLVAGLADRVLLLDLGRVVFEGSPRDCMQSQEMQQVYFGTATAKAPA